MKSSEALSRANAAHYVQAMADRLLFGGIVAACATLALLTVASAQQAQQVLPPVHPQGEADDLREAPSGPLSKAERLAARSAHLDSLFARLANPDAPDWEPVQAQIWTAWNQSGSESMDLLSWRATKAMEAKDYATALIHLSDLTRLAPQFAEGWNKRATVYFLQGDFGNSINDIARTLALEPRHFGALSGLGIILDRIGDKEGALEAYRRAIEIHPHLPGATEGIEKLSKEVEGERL